MKDVKTHIIREGKIVGVHHHTINVANVQLRRKLQIHGVTLRGTKNSIRIVKVEEKIH